MGGVGKTVLATALARDPEIRRCFPGGVYWLSFGQAPEPTLILQARLASAVLGRPVTPTTRAEGEQLLREAFSTRACLVILDDVLGRRSRCAVQRDGGPRQVARHDAEARGRARPRSRGPASRRVGELGGDHSARASTRVCRARRSLPKPGIWFASAESCRSRLAVVGSMLRGKPPDRWRMALDRLRRGVLPDPGHALPQYSHPSLVAALQASVDDLSAGMRSRYLDLAVFAEDVAIPEAALRTYWAREGEDEQTIAEIIDAFVDRSLVRRDSAGRVLLHDLQRDHVRAVAGDLKPLHRRLVDAYRLGAPEGALHLVTPDGYFFEHIAEHVLAAEGADFAAPPSVRPSLAGRQAEGDERQRPPRRLRAPRPRLR